MLSLVKKISSVHQEAITHIVTQKYDDLNINEDKQIVFVTGGLDGQLNSWVFCCGNDEIELKGALVQSDSLQKQDSALKTAHPLAIVSLDLLNNQYLLSSSMEGSGISLWDLSSLSFLTKVSMSPVECWNACWINCDINGYLIASSGFTKEVHLWGLKSAPSPPSTSPDFSSLEKIATISIDTNATNSKFIVKLVASPNGKFLMALWDSGEISIVDPRSKTLAKSLVDCKEQLRSGCFSKDSRWFYCGGNSNNLYIYSMESMELSKCIEGQTSWVLTVDTDITGDFIATGHLNRTCKIFDGSSAMASSSDHLHSEIWAVRFLTQDKLLVACGDKDFALFTLCQQP